MSPQWPAADTSAEQPQSTPKVARTAPIARVFVGLKISAEIASRLLQFIANPAIPSVRTIAVGDIHLTLVPPWNETSVTAAAEKLREVANKFGSFWLRFERIGYGPLLRRPRLIWVECAASEPILLLHAGPLAAYGQSDDRPFRPHVTLARIRGNGYAISRK